jgi:hypothetical protein
MKLRRVRKQGKEQRRQRAKSGLSGMPVIDRRSLSVKSKKGGVWPPYMVKLEKGTVIKVKKMKRK